MTTTTNIDFELPVPANRVIRKRFAARTTGIHLSALPPELREFKKLSRNSQKNYLVKHDLPDTIEWTTPEGKTRTLTRDEAWQLADKAGYDLEWDLLPGTLTGKASAMFSTTGQGLYANYGRPTMDFSGFFHDHLQTLRLQASGAQSSQVFNKVLYGPIFITMDTVSAAGFTALGHFSRGAKLTNKTVVSDIVSTGVYEGTSSWSSAKLGVFTGAKVMALTAVLPIPGARLAAVPLGFLAGAATAILTKTFANEFKDVAIDTAAHQALDHPDSSEEAALLSQAAG